MAKPITGQYEFVHRSGLGLDYFTSRVDRLTVPANGRFVLIIQDRSRMANAAQSLVNGQQVAPTAPETRREGNYTIQGNAIVFRFDDGAQEQGQLSWNGDGLQFGPNFFNKVSDSTLLPPTNRLKKDMDDIAKGLKIASTIGGMAVNGAKTNSETMQPTQETPCGPATTVTPNHNSGTPPRSAAQTTSPALTAPTPAPPTPLPELP